jgi:hypothetical protein
MNSRLGGIVTLRPIGDVVHINPNATDADIAAQQVAGEARQVERQAQVDALVDSMAEKHQKDQQTPPTDKRWSVPFN